MESFHQSPQVQPPSSFRRPTSNRRAPWSHPLNHHHPAPGSRFTSSRIPFIRSSTLLSCPNRATAEHKRKNLDPSLLLRLSFSMIIFSFFALSLHPNTAVRMASICPWPPTVFPNWIYVSGLRRVSRTRGSRLATSWKIGRRRRCL